jgi:hypothetical protein
MLVPLGLADPQDVPGGFHRRHVRRFVAESGTSNATSTIGFAASPGTDVDPTCSIRRARSPRIDVIRRASRSYRAGQPGS